MHGNQNKTNNVCLHNLYSLCRIIKCSASEMSRLLSFTKMEKFQLTADNVFKIQAIPDG